KELTETPGISGQEDRIRRLTMKHLKPLVDEIKIDPMGSIIARKKGTARSPLKVMVAAHMDQIGFIVSFIEDTGFLRISPVGGFDPRTLIAQRVFVHGKKDLLGVLGIKPVHVLSEEEKKKPIQIGDLFVDLGMEKKEIDKVVSVGDMVTLEREFAEMNGSTVCARALDDRLGVYVMIEALKRLKKCQVDVYAVASVQEEVGLRGALTAAFGIEPDIGLAIDVTIACDVPGTKPHEIVTKLGSGVAIKIMDSASISNRKFVDHLVKTAKANKIPYQMEILPRGGTDAGAIERARQGLPVATLSIPLRYVHTVVEMAHTDDIEATIKLTQKYLEQAHRGNYLYS
ncbi:M42 family metallopeptidase, partial [Acidobacteriota bacterium]